MYILSYNVKEEFVRFYNYFHSMDKNIAIKMFKKLKSLVVGYINELKVIRGRLWN